MAGTTNFGFETRLGRQLDLDLPVSPLAAGLAEIIPEWNACISCGSCSATCPAGQIGGLNFRKIHYEIRFQRLELPTFQKLATLSAEKLATLQSCLLCGKCQLVCPRGIPTRYLSIQIMQKIRQYAAEGIPSV